MIMTTDQQTEKATQTTMQALRPVQEKTDNLPTVSVGLTTLQGFDLVQRAAKCLASSSLVPKDYQGNIPNCVVALNMAARVGADPLMVMQNLVVVHGRPTWSSQFLIATTNSCGRFSALRFEFFGTPGKDDWGCRAWAIEKATGEKLVGTDVTIKLAKEEKWYDKNGSKWKTMPQQMLMYRAGSWWTRVYAPELSMGLHTKEEMHDVWDAEQQEDGSFQVNLDSLRNTGDNMPAASNDQTPHDPQTGEIIEPLQPAAIPARALPGDATLTDWDSWTVEFDRFVGGMTDVQSLNKLKKLNESILTNLARINPSKHEFCMESFTIRMTQLGGVEGVAA
jgi:hypothetical protein